ncbi:MAG: hypothetical protein JST54_35140 [Deltaproteobacteria bacterium]|nr:hypothetical protein [Deltaproteobacteria bacterium]
MRIIQTLSVAGLLSIAGLAQAARPAEAKYPNLTKSWDKLQDAKKHLEEAEKAHAKTGGLGGHAANAVKEVAAAEKEIDEAIKFAAANTKAGAPGKVTDGAAKPGAPGFDDKKYPNLGAAHLDCEWAIIHVHEAMEYHAPTGTLGGHGEKAEEHLKAAQKEVLEAEKFAEAHAKPEAKPASAPAK